MTAPEPPAPPTRQPTIRIRCDASGNVEAIETYQGSAGWRNILLEPIQRGDAADLVAALVGVRERRAIKHAEIFGAPPLTYGPVEDDPA